MFFTFNKQNSIKTIRTIQLLLEKMKYLRILSKKRTKLAVFSTMPLSSQRFKQDQKNNTVELRAMGEQQQQQRQKKFSTDQGLNDLREVFSLFDKDGDGNITPEELGVVMRSLGYTPSDEELKSMLNGIDINTNGSIDFEEFATMMVGKMNHMDYNEEMKQAFLVFDQDRNGVIDIHELKLVLTSLGEDLSDKELKDMMDEADVDGNGGVDFEEFCRMMKGTSSS